MAPDRRVNGWREWGTWFVRAVLLCGLAYSGWKVRYIEERVDSLTADVSYIKGLMDGRKEIVRAR